MGEEDVNDLLNDLGIKNSFLNGRIFKAMDADHGGTVDIKEMNFFCRTLAMGSKTEKAKFLFDACDVNDNGLVEKDELRLMVKNLISSCHDTVPNFVLCKSEY